MSPLHFAPRPAQLTTSLTFAQSCQLFKSAVMMSGLGWCDLEDMERVFAPLRPAWGKILHMTLVRSKFCELGARTR